MADPQAPQATKKLINLLRGWPSPSLLPAELIKAAANKVLSDPDVYVPGLQYGPDPGHQGLREELAQFLGGFYGADPDPERICITGGASQSVACILQSYTEPVYTRAVWAVAPCYYLACPIFEDSGFKGRLRAVPEDEEGINLEWLEKGLEEFEAAAPDEPVYKDPSPYRKAYQHVIYVVPTCANPSGKTMSLARREGLVALARKHDALVICDDVYDFLTWPLSPTSSPQPPSSPQPVLSPADPSLPRLFDIDFALGPSPHDKGGKHFGHAISNGSFSKLIGPGIRTGWVEATRDFAFGLAQTGSTKSGGAPSQLSATMVWEILRSGGVAAHIEGACRPALRRRHRLMMDAVRERLGGTIEVLDSNLRGAGTYGGYFVWVTFPDGLAGREVADRAMRDENLVVPPGEMFQVKGDEDAVRFANSIRLCFSWEEEEDIVEGVRRLGRVVETLRKERKEGKPTSGDHAVGESGGLDDFR
ncbi:Aminotransferase [Pleurostoma richardsiae]|uniref:Aminotransferase n=1 Tax=Pleurostoma richardsiae TaxID=41990 RepID=A0AA38VFP5_9PEZI|nr:Aminotransferase [Pleurostoma richardsiae]